jgi:hypothetical protein
VDGDAVDMVESVPSSRGAFCSTYFARSCASEVDLFGSPRKAERLDRRYDLVAESMFVFLWLLLERSSGDISRSVLSMLFRLPLGGILVPLLKYL